MDKKFDNKYTVDKTRFMYMFLHPMKNNKRLVIYNVIMYILLVILCLLCKLFTIGGSAIEIVIVMAWLFFCVYVTVFYRRSFGNKQFNAISNNYGKSEWFVTTEFNENNILITEDTRTVEMEYDKIDEIIVRKGYIGLLQGKEKGVRLDCEGFIDATADEFMVFIKEKCKNAIIIE